MRNEYTREDIDAYQQSLERQADNIQDVGRHVRVGQGTPKGGAQMSGREDAGRYTKGYYDGYADALERIEEQLAAEEEDDYDFGRHYRGKSRRRKAGSTRRERRTDFDEEERYDPPRRRRRKKHPILRALFVLALLAAGLFLLVGHVLFSNMVQVDPVADAVADRHAQSAGVRLKSSPFVRNILLIGSDQRATDGERQRSDTMILCSVDSAGRKITLTSLMRDMYVPIPDYGWNKLNAAYALGDMEALDVTVQEDFGIDVNGNMLVDFDGFLQALTAVGNIDMELTQEEADYLNSGGWEDQGTGANDGSWDLHAGSNSLTPAQSLAYCRIRHVGNSDWDRTERQRKMMMACFSKFRRSNPITQYRVLSEATRHVTTDMTDTKLMALLLRVILAGGSNIESRLIPAEGTYYGDYIDGMDVLVPDLDQNGAILREYIYGSA